MKETRILFWYDGIVNVILEKKGHGGAEVQLYLLAKELSKNKKNKVFISCKKEEISEIMKRNDKKYLNNNLRLSPIIKKKKQINDDTKTEKIGFDKRLIRSINRKISGWGNTISTIVEFIRINPDIIITRTAGRQVNKSATLAKLFGKKSIFMVAHDDECNGKYEKEHPENAKKFIEGIRKTDLIICQNNYQKKEIEKNYGKKSILMRSMYPIELFKETDRKYTLWIGRCEKWKRPEIFIELARNNPSYKFKMICAAAKKEEKYYENIRTKAKKTRNLEFVEYIPFHIMDEEFRKAKLFTNTSVAEGFPNTFIQAMKNKTPVLSLNVDPDEILEKNKIGIVCNNDVKKFNIQFKEIISDKKVLVQMSKNGFEYSRNNHDITRISKEYETIFEELKK